MHFESVASDAAQVRLSNRKCFGGLRGRNRQHRLKKIALYFVGMLAHLPHFSGECYGSIVGITHGTSVLSTLNCPSAGSLIGGIDAHGTYHETAFIHAYETGGVYLLDEIDAAPAEILVAVNAALANGHLSLPRHHDHARRTIKRHPNTVIFAAANTYGTGATAQYVGRSQIDAATLDRFTGAVFTIGYDAALERQLCPDETTREIVQNMRAACESAGMRRIVSTRAVIAAARMNAAGFDAAEIVDRLTQGWTAEEKKKAGVA